MKILVYTRPRINVFFHELVKHIDIFKEVEFISDHKGLENISIMDFFYVAKGEVLANEINPKTESFQNAVIQRCRFLRTLPDEEAITCVKSMWIAIERICEIHQPDYIFGMVMDSYVMDIMDRVMRERGGQYIGFLNNMVNGYSRLTSRGELIKYRNPSEDEIEKVVKNLNDRYYVPFMQNDFMWNTKPLNMFFTKYLKEKIKIVYYWLLKILKSDPNNFYYNTVSSKHCMACRELSYIFIENWGDNEWKSKIEAAKKEGKKILYFPLQFYPECSIDYWGTNSKLIKFYEIVDKLLSTSSQEIVIIVKEHPSSLGLRRPSFYKKFDNNKNVILTPSNANSNEVINESDCVLTWTGSVGIESIVRKKPLITFGKAYYAYEDSFYQIESIDQLSNISKIVCDLPNTHSINEGADLNNIVKNLLSGLVPGYIFPLDYLTKKHPRNDTEMKLLGKNISTAISSFKGGNYPVEPGVLQ